ncbi:peptidylprolyl isomerase [Ruminococcaceae bacterium OttesenSCG-928-O06]|nr:peptidylprolyl isomerase [Ruminococcaceae bacterium OttesenSCG-928-O06]
MKRRIGLVLVAVFLLCACAKSEAPGVGGSTRRDAVFSEEVQFSPAEENAVYALLETDRGEIKLVLYPENAPLAVENFCRLAQQGYYDGTEFHRVVEDFVIQGGDATGTGLSGQSVWGAPFQTEYSEQLHHYSGAVCMAAANGQADTHLSQFYIVCTPQDSLSEAALARLLDAGIRQEVVDTYRQGGGAPYLDYTDTVFGQVVEGMDVVDAIAKVSTDEDARPKTQVVVQRVTITGWPPVEGTSAASPPASAAPGSQTDTSVPTSDVSPSDTSAGE